ncbi:MAG: Multidrug export protein EmrB [Chlamydiae bacterium]|nr:Multidrug export protein EmrB [Chlamydiota bacterium]
MDQKILNWNTPYLYRPDHPLWKFIIVLNVTYGGMLVLMDLLASVMVISQIQGAMAVDYDKIIWTARGVLFVLAITPLFGLRLARHFGYKKIFLIGSLIFLTGSIFTALSSNFYELLPSRLFTAVGGGLMSSLGLPIINHTIQEVENRRPIVTAYSSVSFGLGIALGMIMGGYFGQLGTWKMVFLSNLTLVPPLMLITILFHPETPRKKQPPYDILSLVSITVFLLSLLFIVTQVKAEWNTLAWRSTFIISCALTSVFSLIVFLWNSLTHPTPLFNLSLFLHRQFFLGCLCMLVVGFMVFGVTLATLGILQNIYNYEWIRLGWFMSLVGFTYFAVGAIPSLTIRWINPRVFIYIGLGLIAASCFLSQSITIQSDKYEIGAIVFLRSSGIALSLGPIAVLSLSVFEGDAYAKGSSLINFIRMLGGVFGSALIQLISAYRMPFHSLRFGEMVNVESARYQQYFAELFTTITEKGSNPELGVHQTRELIIEWITSQAEIAAILDAEYVLGWVVIGVMVIFATAMVFRFWGKFIVRFFVPRRMRKI